MMDKIRNPYMQIQQVGDMQGGNKKRENRLQV